MVLQLLTLALAATTLAAAAFRWSVWGTFVDQGESEDRLGAADAWLRNMLAFQILTAGAVAAIAHRWAFLLDAACTSQGRVERFRTPYRLAWFVPVGQLLLPFVPLKSLHRSLGSARGSVERWQWCSALWFVATVAGHMSTPPTAKSFGTGSDRLWFSTVCLAVGLAAAVAMAIDSVRVIRSVSDDLDSSWAGRSLQGSPSLPVPLPTRTSTRPNWQADRLLAVGRVAEMFSLAALLANVGMVVRVWQRNRAWLYGNYNHDGTYSDYDYWQDAQWEGRVFGFLFALGFFLAIATIPNAVWMFRATRNAQRCRSAATKPALACAACFVPVANLVVPFSQLRAAGPSTRTTARCVTLWQTSFALTVAAVTYLPFRLIAEGTNNASAADLWITFGVSCLAAVFASVHLVALHLAHRWLRLEQDPSLPGVAPTGAYNAPPD